MAGEKLAIQCVTNEKRTRKMEYCTIFHSQSTFTRSVRKVSNIKGILFILNRLFSELIDVQIMNELHSLEIQSHHLHWNLKLTSTVFEGKLWIPVGLNQLILCGQDNAFGYTFASAFIYSAYNAYLTVNQLRYTLYSYHKTVYIIWIQINCVCVTESLALLLN